MGPTDGSDPARMELALWLWEVHNSVNARLMKEAAARQNREVSLEETLASRFPTKKMCPDCWLDANMTKWDNKKVFQFIDDWYWPDHEPVDEQFSSVVAGKVKSEDIAANVRLQEDEMATDVESSYASETSNKSSMFPTSQLGMGLASLFCLIAFSMLVVAAAQKKRRERRKKFIDSRYVVKKKGCL
eukprot:CAMPEP_0183729796 /NCGR_PEP_ID=MMETSP0737-20130205/31255_1 /TAXON_ID=385413 /ORGANISM="Thalassiosira miniscula, Strain CCMP1093" /LENGTH=186 /DNA_ID=CAMNT_0025962099 /DNA_START=118 /DNA_END=678 /DNA_ORIENTATION=+